eukprot:SAG11_NODE_2791_length_2968_cov_5.763681_3_plen_80_part_00
MRKAPPTTLKLNPTAPPTRTVRGWTARRLVRPRLCKSSMIMQGKTMVGRRERRVNQCSNTPLETKDSLNSLPLYLSLGS